MPASVLGMPWYKPLAANNKTKQIEYNTDENSPQKVSALLNKKNPAGIPKIAGIICVKKLAGSRMMLFIIPRLLSFYLFD
jgi:hypothetical protein